MDLKVRKIGIKRTVQTDLINLIPEEWIGDSILYGYSAVCYNKNNEIIGIIPIGEDITIDGIIKMISNK